MKKIFALILSLSMLACVFTSCVAKVDKKEKKEIDKSYTKIAERVETLEKMGDLDKNTLVNVEGVPMSEAAVRFAVLSTSDAFEKQEDRDKEIKDFYLLNAAIIKKAADLNVEFDDDLFKQEVEAMQVYYKQYYGEEYEKTIADSAFTPYFLYLNQSYNVLFGKIFAKYTEDPESEMAKRINADTVKEVAEVLEKGNFVRAKHILIQFPEDIEKDEEGNVIESAKAETRAKANDVLAKVQAMTDPSEFDALVKEYGQDPGMESYPAGYYFTEGEMVKPFEEAAFALEEYGVSGLVETTYGYHIIQRLPFDTETYNQSNIVQTYNEIYNSYAVEEMKKILFERAKDYEIVYEDEYEDAVKKYQKEYNDKQEAAKEAE